MCLQDPFVPIQSDNVTRTKKEHKEKTLDVRKKKRRGQTSSFYGVKFLRNTIGKEACLRYLFIYLFIFDQLKFMYLCFIRIFRYSYYHEEAGSISDTSTKIIIIIINNRNKNNEDQLW